MANRVIYVGTASDHPIGGIRVLYRHVELLVKEGFDAAIWNPVESITNCWFNSSAPVLREERIILDETDMLVIPESFVCTGKDPAPGCRKVIYNQGHLLTFTNTSAAEYPAWDPQPPMWVSSLMSRSIVRRLQTVLPIGEVAYIPHSIDTDLFYMSNLRQRKVAWIPRKRRLEAEVLRTVFAADQRFNGIKLRPIDALTEQQIAAELATTSVFVPLGLGEGFGLPIAEALASGCAVVGYPAGGGAELFRAPGTYAIPESDILAIVEQVATVLADEPSSEERLNYRKWIKENYHVSQQLQALTKAIGSAREVPAASGHATHPLPFKSETADRTPKQ